MALHDLLGTLYSVVFIVCGLMLVLRKRNQFHYTEWEYRSEQGVGLYLIALALFMLFSIW